LTQYYLEEKGEVIQNQITKNEITIVIPVLNEEEAIENVIESVKEEGYYNILVVDGNSTDRTYEIASNMGVNVIIQKGEGKTGAIITAIETIKTPYLIIIDGDSTYYPSDIIKLLKYLNDYDEIIGSRIIGRENIPLFNRFGNGMINGLFNLLYGTNLKDVCSGMYALKTDFAKNLDLKTSGFEVEVEIASKTVRKGKIYEVPISYGTRIGERKLNPLKDGLRIVITIIKNFINK
jgi:dolichol-phosphate mannosyltransferase